MATEIKRVIKSETLRGVKKMVLIPMKVAMSTSTEIARIINTLREHKLSSVCEEANCSNLVRSSYQADKQAHVERIV
jgi:lipoyl synthase